MSVAADAALRGGAPVRRLVLYAVSSPLVVDAEESCARAGIAIVAGVRNVDADAHTSAAVRVIAPDEVTDAERACPVLVVLFTPGHRRHAMEEALRAGFSGAATVVDPTATIARSVSLGAGVYVNAASVIAGACELSDYVLVNRSASVGHNARIGTYASIGPGVVLAGNVTIGRGAMIGAGAIVLPQVEIGANAVVAAGSVVRHSVPANTLAAGNPCRIARAAIAGYKDLSIP
ncbi:MAG TPA: DapH/DapD/GlmU-related protein [Casimicrobiaceae bacterium]|nr:DapH/DapD/GlmU-related protein [Casimicrobiaceae bacterium]